MSLSVCIITKNQAAKLKKCLSAVKPYPFEIVVVDTGSEDESVEVASKFTRQVYSYAWQNDFAAAKNYAISKATNSIVMVLDTDEYLEALDWSELENMILANTGCVGRICCVNLVEEEGQIRRNVEYLNRIFDREIFCYEGKIHEQLIHRRDGLQYTTYRSNVTIEHDGYLLSPKEKAAKVNRNKVLLQEALLEAPQDSYLQYQLGKTYFIEQDYNAAAEWFEKVLANDLDPALEYVIDTVESYGYVLLRTGRTEEAASYENIYPEFGHTADFQFLMGLIYMNNRLFDEAVKEFEKAAVNPEVRATNIAQYSAYYNAGVIQQCLGDYEKAMYYYEKCKAYPKAEDRIKEIGKIRNR